VEQTKGEASKKIELNRAIPMEYHVILNSMPRDWLQHDPQLLHLQVADMINSNRFLIANSGDTLVGGVGWQNDIAFGACYVKFLYVKEEYRNRGVAFQLMKEVVRIAVDSNQRAVFADIPSDAPILRTVNQVPGTREVGRIEDFHSKGATSVIVTFDMNATEKFFSHADRFIREATDVGEGQAQY
jgi:GNAT superfamily N-acetyltransferase